MQARSGVVCLLGDSIFSGVHIGFVLYPYFNLFIAVGDDLPVVVFSVAVFFMDGPVTFFNPSYMSLMFPVSENSWMF